MQAQAIKCSLCEKTAKAQSNLMYHRKEFHENIVELCTKVWKHECSFGEQCWYKHTANGDKKETIDNYNELIQRLWKILQQNLNFWKQELKQNMTENTQNKLK